MDGYANNTPARCNISDGNQEERTIGSTRSYYILLDLIRFINLNISIGDQGIYLLVFSTLKSLLLFNKIGLIVATLV